jgi:beta-1,4-N-acetylglucosaminyltransferase
MKKLFVTVGSTKFPELIEAIISKDFISLLLDLKFSHLVVQSGSTPVPPMSLQDLEVTWYSYKPSIIDDMKDAYMIISHAGSGSILEALSMDKKLLVVINESLMDNHQVDLANELSPDYLIASSISNLLSNFIICYNAESKRWATADYSLTSIVKEELGI